MKAIDRRRSRPARALSLIPKRARRLVPAWLLLSGALLLLGCLRSTGDLSPAAVARAPFRLRPDTTHWGSLLGPFDGQVVERASGSPVSGALVVGTWFFNDGELWPTGIGSYSSSTTTSGDGLYALPGLPSRERRLALLRRFTLVVYKAGFVGYRSDFHEDDGALRHDFAQHTAKLPLERLAPGESLAQKLVFLGGGQSVLHSAQADLIAAAMELAERDAPPGAAPKPRQPRVDSLPAKSPPAPSSDPTAFAAQLLTLSDVEQIASVSEAKLYRKDALPQRSLAVGPSASYAGVHYRGQGQPETADATLRVYRFSNGQDSQAFWLRLRTALLVPPIKDQTTSLPVLTAPMTRPDLPLVFPVAATPQAASATPDPGAQRMAQAPLVLTETLRLLDPNQRTHATIAHIRSHGLILEFLCGGDLCPSDRVAAELFGRILGRL